MAGTGSSLNLVLFTEATANQSGKGRIIKVALPLPSAAEELQDALFTAIDPSGGLGKSNRYSIRRYVPDADPQTMPAVESLGDLMINGKIVICAAGAGGSTPAPESEGLVGAKHTRPNANPSELETAGGGGKAAEEGGGDDDLLSKKRKRVNVATDESYQAIEGSKLVDFERHEAEVAKNKSGSNQTGAGGDLHPMHPMVINEDGDEDCDERSPNAFLAMLEDQLKNRNGGKLTPDQVPGLEQILDENGVLRNADESRTSRTGKPIAAGVSQGQTFDRRELVATRHDNNRTRRGTRGGNHSNNSAVSVGNNNAAASDRVVAGTNGRTLPENRCYFCQCFGHIQSLCPKLKQDPGLKHDPTAEKLCIRCRKPGHLIANCPERDTGYVQGSSNVSNMVCLRCNQKGHLVQNCPVPDDRKCDHCQKVGHIQKFCPELGASRYANNTAPTKPAPGAIVPGSDGVITPKAKCFNCECVGHIQAYCPKPKQESTAGTAWKRTRQCLRCKEPGHTASNCPQPRGFGMENNSKRCDICDQLGHLRKDCPRAGGGGGSCDLVCLRCNQKGHKVQDCPVPDNRKCEYCQKVGHIMKFCPELGSGSTHRKYCKNCKQVGHTMSVCPDIVCMRCNQRGHMSGECPVKRQEGGREKKRFGEV